MFRILTIQKSRDAYVAIRSVFSRLIKILFPVWCTSGTTRPPPRSLRPWLCPSQSPTPAATTSSSAPNTPTSLWRTEQNMSAWQSTTGRRVISQVRIRVFTAPPAFIQTFPTVQAARVWRAGLRCAWGDGSRGPRALTFTFHWLRTGNYGEWARILRRVTSSSSGRGSFDGVNVLRCAEVQTFRSTCSSRWLLTRGWSRRQPSSSGSGRWWSPSPTRRGRCSWGSSGDALAFLAPSLTSAGGISLCR